MSSEESYLDSLLNNILNPEVAEPKKEQLQIDTAAEDQVMQESELEKMESVTENLQISDTDRISFDLSGNLADENVAESADTTETLILKNVTDSLEDTLFPEEETRTLEELLKSEEIPEEPLILEEIPEVSEEPLILEEIPEVSEESLIPEEMAEIPEEPLILEEIPEVSEEPLILEEIPEVLEEIAPFPEELSELDLAADSIDTEFAELMDTSKEVIVEEETPSTELPIMEEKNTLETQQPDINSFVTEEVVAMNGEESALIETGASDSGGEFNLEDKEMPGPDDDFKLEDIEIPELSDLGVFQDSELNIDGLENAIQSETELEMAGELNIDELGLDNEDLTMPITDFNISDFELADLEMQDAELLSDSTKDLDIEIPDISDETNPSDVIATNESDSSINMDDNLEDVLNMLDDDAELAEINDMLKKSDNNEPIQDDMMDLLNQMADDEAASVNAGLDHTDEDDGGVPLPTIPQSVLEEAKAEEKIESDESKKAKKGSAKKKKKGNEAEDAEIVSTKEPGKLAKFFNMLTEELVPEPTEEELAAEKEAKKTKKQEELTKKEEEKLAKQEEKQAKAEEKAAAKKAKQEEAAKKKQEKKAQKEAKKAKQAANGVDKRIPPKKLAVVVAFGLSVGGAVIISTNVLSTQGFLQTARNAYYEGDYKTVYQATYGMNLDGTNSDNLIREKSKIIYKMQRKYDSYENNLKMGRELEALDALLQGLVVYDTVNADAQMYEVTAEIDEIKSTICSILETKYHLDETQARELLRNEDALAYTVALNNVITQN